MFEQLLAHQPLSQAQAITLMQDMMTGKLTEPQIAAYLTAFRMKGIVVEELYAFAKVMREQAHNIAHADPSHLVDIVGTGGDGLQTFNISTTASFVVAGAGATIAKHGNRSASGLLGSADLLEAVGINLQAPASLVEDCINSIGIGFLFAPNHHPAMKHVKSVRKQLGFHTFFNLLGPLTNPSHAQRQLIGVFDKAWLKSMAHCLKKLGSIHSLLVHSEDGMDEISCFANSHIVELNNNTISQYQINPKHYQLDSGQLSDIIINNITDAKNLFFSVLNGEHGTARNIVVLNSGAALYCAGLAPDIGSGIELALASIDSGKANQCYLNLREKTHEQCT